MKSVAPLLILLLFFGCPQATTTVPTPSQSPTPSKTPASVGPGALAWFMGHEISLAALGRARGGDPSSAERLIQKAEVAGRELGLEDLPNLPNLSGDETKDTAEALHYVLKTAGEPLARSLAEKHGQKAADLFEMAAKANIALMLYTADPEDKTTKALTDRLEALGKSADLPDELWKPIIEKMRAGAPKEEVQGLLAEMSKKTREYLMTQSG